jgi:hypothetical protein
MAVSNGKQRTLNEFNAIAEATGWKISRIDRSPTVFELITMVAV